MSNPISVGIDLGTTFSAAAYVNENGQPEIIANQSQNNAVNLPSVVYYESESSIVVGDAALSEAEMYPDKTLRFAKRYIGETFPLPEGVPQGETPVKFQAKVLGAIKSYVEDHESSYEVKNAVITVPAYFDFNKKNLTRDAAVIAGIDVLGIISEPMAAAIYYCSNQAVDNQKFLVYDLGGGTFDSVIIEYRIKDGRTEIITLASDGNHQLGGYDWDKALVSFLFEQAKKQNSDIPSLLNELEADDRQTLYKIANELKIILSKNDEKKKAFKIEGIPVEVTVTREDFEDITKDLLKQTGNKVDSVLQQAGLSEDDIDLVLLVGGSTFMPMIQNYVRGRFGEDKVKLNNPNLAVAYGAAIYAHNMDIYLAPEAPASSIIPPPPETGERNTDEGDWDFDEPEADAVPAPPNRGTDIGIRVVEEVSHSVGVRVSIRGKSYVKNLVFKGDHYSADEPLVVSYDGFTCMDDGGFTAAFYNNIRTERFSKTPDDYETADEYLDDYTATLLEVTRNPSATSADDAFIALESKYQLAYLGELHFEDEGIRSDDQIKVTLTANQKGIFADVEHAVTGSQTLKFENKDTHSDEELQAEREAQTHIKISLT